VDPANPGDVESPEQPQKLLLGAVFATRAGTITLTDGPTAVGHLARSDVIDGVQAVFAVAATIALAGLVIVLRSRTLR